MQFGQRRPVEVPVRHLKAKASETVESSLRETFQKTSETFEESVRERSVSPPRPLKATKAATALREMLSIASPSRPRPKEEPEGSWPLGNVILRYILRYLKHLSGLQHLETFDFSLRMSAKNCDGCDAGLLSCARV